MKSLVITFSPPFFTFVKFATTFCMLLAPPTLQWTYEILFFSIEFYYNFIEVFEERRTKGLPLIKHFEF